MKKLMVVLMAVIFAFGINGCRNKNNKPDSVDESVAKEKEWTKQDIRALFIGKSNNSNWEIEDCVVTPDFAFDRVGVVLFTDNEKKTSNVAFLSEDGDYQTCGVFAKTCSESELTYCGNGEVTFKLETEEGIAYNCKITLSIEDSCVNFVVEDDL